jgi:hypothetical protein
MSKQKFFRGQRVRICDKFPEYMSHFSGTGCVAIVQYSYSDVYGPPHEGDYSLLIFENNHWFSVSWYKEDQLTLIDNDRDAGERILQEYKYD